MKTLRAIADKSLHDKVGNEKVRQIYEVEDIVT